MKAEGDFGAVGTLSRSELQRITQMLRETATKAGWVEEQPQPVGGSSTIAVRH
jgi:hypothetical protein